MLRVAVPANASGGDARKNQLGDVDRVVGQVSAHCARPIAIHETPLTILASALVCLRGSQRLIVVESNIHVGGQNMRLSIRNQLKGKVESIKAGSVMTIVKVTLKGGQTVTSSITKEAVKDLGLKVGSAVVVLVKSTEVMLGVE
jgi:molybdopterin-binding protein